MKFIRIIQIIVIAVLVLMISGLAWAWSRHENYRHYKYDNYNRHYYRHRGVSPYYRNYRYPGHTRHYYPGYKDNYTMDDGWNLIKKGRSHTALEIFGKLAKSNPGDGSPKLGYSIAAADTDRLSKSVWAMRRALQYHPGALQHFKLDLRLESKLKRLVSKYQRRSHGLPDKDAFFMQASLYYLLEDKNSCFEAISRSKEANDYSDSAKNLYYMAENYL
jgi:hypothetical protein